MNDSQIFATQMPDLDTRISSVLRYWDQLRGDRVAPGRVEIRPAAITRHLSRICILERPRAGTVRMRLAGATISARMGMELRGMPFRALFELDDRSQAMDAAETAITTPAVSFLSLARAERTGPADEAMMAILPLSDTRGALTRAIAIYSERAAVTPFISDIRGRFHITDSWSLDIPETGPILGQVGLTGTQKPISTRVLSPRGSAQYAPQLVASQNLAAQDLPSQGLPHEDLAHEDLPHRAKPVFQVIDGGLT